MPPTARENLTVTSAIQMPRLTFRTMRRGRVSANTTVFLHAAEFLGEVLRHSSWRLAHDEEKSYATHCFPPTCSRRPCGRSDLGESVPTALAEFDPGDAREAIDIAVVGGGVSGTYCCWRLQAAQIGHRPTLFETSDRIGGRLLSIDLSRARLAQHCRRAGWHAFPKFSNDGRPAHQ